jgi:hypothetical protein
MRKIGVFESLWFTLAAGLVGCGAEPPAGPCGPGASAMRLVFGEPLRASGPDTALVRGQQGGCHVAVGVVLTGPWADRVDLEGAVVVGGQRLEARRRLRVAEDAGGCRVGPFPVVVAEPAAAVGSATARFEVTDERGNWAAGEALVTILPAPECGE